MKFQAQLRFSTLLLYTCQNVSGATLSVKLTCQSWQQLSAIYSRDLCRGAFFLKTKKPPPLGTAVRISLTLPSDSTVELHGSIHTLVGPGELDGRGPGVDIALHAISNSVMWLIESALKSAGLTTSSAQATSSQATNPVEDNHMEDGEDWVDAQGDLVQSLWEELNTMSKLNAFQRLNLSYETTDAEVRSAFGALSKRYHPDRFARYQSFEIRELANEVFILLRDSYREIGKEEGRRKSLAKINPSERSAKPPKLPSNGSHQASAPVPPKTPPPSPISPKPPTVNQVSTPVPLKTPPPPPSPNSPKPPTVSQQISTPVPPQTPPSLSPNSPIELSRSFGSSPIAATTGANINPQVEIGLRVLQSGQYEQALRILRVELRKSPTDVAVRVAIELAEGRFALASGDRMEAAERFEVALDIDPSNEWAAREIADMRRHVTSQRRGLLSKLMKKV